MRGARALTPAGPLLLALAWGLVAEARAAEPDASEAELYASEAGRFRVLFPAEPELHKRSRRTWLGRVSNARYVVERDGGFWAVETHDIPRGATLLIPARVILNRARKAFVDDYGRQEIGRSDTMRGGHPAQRIRYTRPSAPDGPRVAELVLVGSRIYIVIGNDSPSARKTLDPERFLGSFGFWDEASPPPRPSFVWAPPSKPGSGGRRAVSGR